MKKKDIKKRLDELCKFQKEEYEEMLVLLKEGTFEEFEEASWALVETQKAINFYAHLLEEAD